MCEFRRREVPLAVEGTINRLNAELDMERQRSADLEGAVVELGELAAAHDDAIVELAALIEEGL